VDLCMLTGGLSYGEWRLVIRNHGTFGGTFNSWSLHLKGVHEVCRTDARYPAGPFPVVVPDNNSSGASSTVEVPGSFDAAAVGVYVSVSHPYRGDLVVTLTSPEGASCMLHNRSGGDTDNLITVYPDETAPVEDLGVFAGESAGGSWTLNVVDAAGAPSAVDGELNGWILYVH
jgi:subtilisin-like proprotein convertase family protein